MGAFGRTRRSAPRAGRPRRCRASTATTGCGPRGRRRPRPYRYSDDFVEECRFGGVCQVDGLLGDAGLRGDRGHARADVAVSQEQSLGGKPDAASRLERSTNGTRANKGNAARVVGEALARRPVEDRVGVDPDHVEFFENSASSGRQSDGRGRRAGRDTSAVLGEAAASDALERWSAAWNAHDATAILAPATEDIRYEDSIGPEPVMHGPNRRSRRFPFHEKAAICRSARQLLPCRPDRAGLRGSDLRNRPILQ